MLEAHITLQSINDMDSIFDTNKSVQIVGYWLLYQGNSKTVITMITMMMVWKASVIFKWLIILTFASSSLRGSAWLLMLDACLVGKSLQTYILMPKIGLLEEERNDIMTGFLETYHKVLQAVDVTHESL